MIFSLLNVRKKTAAILAGITIAALCLWGLSMWKDISLEEMLNILLGTVIMLGAIMLGAFLLIAALKLLIRIWQKVTHSEAAED
ncbi:MAG: hypothetical protein GKR91_04610 [Pseudomonadales bacterium]|nr:hypothetical protein [Pseudomonadales bacterium]